MHATFGLLFLALSQAVVVRDLHREAPLRTGQVVKVMHRYGGLTLKGSGTDRLRLDARVAAEAQDEAAAGRISDAIDVLVMSQEETLVVLTKFPKVQKSGSESSYEVNLNVVLPSRARVVASNAFGDLSASGIQGRIRLLSRFGNVEIEDCRDCDVVSRYGDVWVRRSQGVLAVQNSFGDVFLDEVSERVRVENRYGDVEGVGIEGIVHLANLLGKVVARQGRGILTVENRYGDVAAWVDDTALHELGLVSEMGQVELNLARRMPFRLGCQAVEGSVHSDFPLAVTRSGERCLVSTQSGKGGPVIDFQGLWTDFLIRSGAGVGPSPREKDREE